jgi:uncharacterized protein YbaR (Trm112 family)
VYDKPAQELICKGDRLAYPIRDGIPVMWADQARDLNDSAGDTPNTDITLPSQEQ